MSERNIPKNDAAYRGSVGLISPLYNTILKSWTGAHPTKGKRCRIYNFSDTEEYKLFLIDKHISFEAHDVAFVDEEHARMLAERDKTNEEGIEPDQEHEARIAEINDKINANKVPGQLIQLSYAEGKIWNFPIKEQDLQKLANAFNVAATSRVHVNVYIRPYSLDMSCTYARPTFEKRANLV